MSTYAPDNLLWLADEWEDAIGSAVCSGIVADNLHVDPSKHHSYEDNPSGSWPRQHGKDQQGPNNMACAIDMSMSDADMKKVTNRFVDLYNNRHHDVRAQYVYAFNGWTGSGGAKRWNLYYGSIDGTDDSHKWHVHVESYYCYTDQSEEAWNAVHAILSVVKGQTEAEYLQGDDDMTDEERGWLKNLYYFTFYGGSGSCGYQVSPIDGREPTNALVDKVDRALEGVAMLAAVVEQLAQEAGLDESAVLTATADATRELRVPRRSATPFHD